MPPREECFVYIQLPGSLDPVVCGRFERAQTRDGGAVGRFVYGRTYRERPDALPIDPIHLPITPTVYETARLEGVFGALRDASPDAWGRRVIERIAGRPLDEVDFLLESPQDRAGALSFGRGPVPPAPVREYNRVVQLEELRRAAALFEEDRPDEPVPAQILDLLDPGSSLGGARPKNVVEDDAGLWIAKFPQRGDRWNIAAVEAAMLGLAARCGIRVPEARVERVGADSVLLVKRFDREMTGDQDGRVGYFRHRMVSALTVVDAEDRATERRNWSYVLLADELGRWSSRPRQDREELFRRMVLNALISNVDDHPRNHALVAPGREWRLAPAYDLTPNSRQGTEDRRLAMECGVRGRLATRENLLSQSLRFGLNKDDADAIIREMQQTIGRYWRADVLRNGGSERDCEKIEAAFVYPGFEYPVAD